MNELLEQFLAESREALQGIGERLMDLENAPQDQELMTQLFRLVHTLKGNSGLFDFPDMTRVLHAGEDLMDAVRNGKVVYSRTLADRLLDAMDFVSTLCDDIEQGRPTDSGASRQAVVLAKALRELLSEAQAPSPEPVAAAAAATPEPAAAQSSAASATSAASSARTAAAGTSLPADLAQRIPEAVRLDAWKQSHEGAQLWWVSYKPTEECFFQGEDPLHQARRTPGALWGGMVARTEWPKLAELDAYRCMLDFDVLASGPREAIEEHYRYVPEQIDVQAVNPASLAVPQGDPNGGPVYEDFVGDALELLDKGDLKGLKRAVSSMLELSNSKLWLSSALRWMGLVLSTTTPSTSMLRALIVSLRTLTPPVFDAEEEAVEVVSPSPAVEVAAKSATEVAGAPVVDASRLEALEAVLTVQREILALPDDAPWIAGRLKGVTSALTGCLRAMGAASELASLQAASEQSVQSKSASPLKNWLMDRSAESIANAATAAPKVTSAVAPAATVATAVAAPVAARAPAPTPAPAPAPAPVKAAATAAAPSEPAPRAEAAAPQDAEVADGEVRMNRRADDTSSAKTLKVDQSKVDRLMNLIGEMVVAKNAIPFLANRAETVFGMRELAREIKMQYAVINRITDEMQDAIMQVRMLPVSFVFQRFPRLVRDISRRLGKEVNLVLEGQDTAADKNIIESLADPLIHIIRNSLDHGLEMPEVRQASGKPAMGSLRIQARQDSDRVLIEISDDGRGIDPEVIKHKAYQKKLIDEATLDRISDQDAINLVFAPGFSTAEVVSDLSGRGVGMDVVRSTIERVNGSITLESKKGQGTRITLSLPLSMAVTNVMMVASDSQLFGVPLELVTETVRVPVKNVRSIKQRQAVVLRGRVVPLISLNSLLHIAAPPVINDDDEYAVLLVRIGEESVGLLVDEFHGTADIILKPLAGMLGRLHCYAGSALLGDGSVLMVLNLKEVL